MSEELAASILTELRKLPLRPDIAESELELPSLLLEYAIDRAAGRERQSTSKQALKEIQTCLQTLSKLERVADNLSPTALKTLKIADSHINPNRLFGPISLLSGRFFLPRKHDKNLQLLKEAEKLLNTCQGKPERGRKPNVRARSLSLALAETYFKLTGQRPTRRTDWTTGKYYGPFVEFVEVCFKLAGLDAAPHEYARFAANNFEGSKGVNPPD